LKDKPPIAKKEANLPKRRTSAKKEEGENKNPNIQEKEGD
jgi:hypothetical protein